MLDRSITPAIDSCKRLIIQKAQQAYKRIPAENKRHIDFEDLVQEGLIAAWKAEQTFDAEKSKYSTYLYNGLGQIFNGINGRLRQPKRASNGMAELDAPVNDESDETFGQALPDYAPSALEVQEAVSSLLLVFGAAKVPVQLLMLEVTSGTWRMHRRYIKQMRQLRKLSKLHQVSERDYRLLVGNADVKTQLIEGMAKVTNIEVADARLLLCGQCSKLFSLTDVREGRYVASSLACTPCLTKLQALPVNSTCFGKGKVVQDDGRTLREGFSESNAACRLHCRDRVACKQFARKRTHMTGEAAGVLDDVDLEDVKVEATPKTKAKPKAGLKLVDKAKTAKKAKKTVKVAKTAKPVKKAKKAEKTAKKAKVAPGDRKQRTKKSAAKIDPHSEKGKALIKASLDEEGRDLPYKNGSMLRELFVMAMKPDMTLKKIVAHIKAKGYNDKMFQLPALRSGKSGDSSLRPYPSTHTWKLDEEDGRFHIHGVKRIACYERLARINLSK